MELLRFSYTNLRRKPADAFFFAFSMFSASLVITMFFAIIANPYYGSESLRDASAMSQGGMSLVYTLTAKHSNFIGKYKIKIIKVD